MTPTRILVPVDFSPCADHALEYACSLAADVGASIVLVNALGAAPSEVRVALGEALLASLLGAHREALEAMTSSRLSTVVFDSPIVVAGDPRDAIVEAVKTTGADLVVMGTHGRRGLARVVMGSVAEDVVRSAPCPVITVRDSPQADRR